jgi:hypothetical protein
MDIDSEEEFRSSFPKNPNSSKLRVKGGDQRPDVSDLSEKEAEEVIDKWRKQRKAFTDKVNRAAVRADHEMRKFEFDSREEALGDHSTQLRAMSVVNACRLSAGHVFQLKDTLRLRIVEEANLRRVKIKVMRSDIENLIVAGFHFYVCARYSKKVGWTVLQACCREGDDILMIPMNCLNISENTLRTPLQSKMIAPIIANAVEETPGISYQMIREILSPFVNDYALTDNILQDGRHLAKVERFGVPEDNVQFAHGVFTELTAMGHEVFFLYTDRAKTLKNVSAVVLLEELERKKKEKISMSRAERREYLSNWMTDHDIFLNTALGSEGGTPFKFLTGILLAPSTSKAQAPFLRDVIQADGAHMSFGKYTLFTAYGTTANANMSPLAYGIFFGNEDKENWSRFWAFVKRAHPIINTEGKTIITDQDKGSIAAVKEIIPIAAQFMCSYHRRQNIIKKCGGGSGKKPLSCLWMFNLLSSCCTVHQIEILKEKYLENMYPTDRHYLLSIPDESQFRAARCAMTSNAQMNGESASSGVESMNRANMNVRQKTAVDALNAILVLIKGDSVRFEKYKKQAWDRTQLLTPRGMIEMEEAYKDVNQREYRLDVTEVENGHVAKVSKTNANAKQFVVFIPKEETLGSRFGSCTCGVPATEGIPCRHMVVLAKSNVIHGLTRVNTMPLWWTTAQWRNQFPIEATMRSDISMNAIKTRHARDELLRYCPVWSAAAKKGRPKKHERRKSIMDHIEESAKKKRKRTKRMYCSICEKFNHNTKDCYKKQVEGVSGDINFDLSAQIGEKSDEHAEAPV